VGGAPNVNHWAEAGHALEYLRRADKIPHRTEGEASLLSLVPKTVRRILDLGTGDGRLLALLLIDRPDAEGIALDFSPTMLSAARDRFRDFGNIKVIEHNLDEPLPDLGVFDAIVSSFAIHHCSDERKRELYAEIYAVLSPGGVFFNLEHVAPASAESHAEFLRELGISEEDEDPSNRLLSPEVQIRWLQEIGFRDMNCWWRWLELALIGGIKTEQ
jgi:SAM-dependent methyltransferase